jgi:hypothetical protein
VITALVWRGNCSQPNAGPRRGPNEERTRARGVAVAIVCTDVIALWITPKAHADAWDKKAIVTINAPVEIPGRVLLPGTYVFKLLNSSSNRNIVQIYDKDEKQLQATLLAVPDYRVMPADKPLIRFEERPSNTPEAIKAWFYPSENTGWEFRSPSVEVEPLSGSYC